MMSRSIGKSPSGRSAFQQSRDHILLARLSAYMAVNCVRPGEALTERCIDQGRCGFKAMRCEQPQTGMASNKFRKRAKGSMSTTVVVS